jgi:hypothetical protein
MLPPAFTGALSREMVSAGLLLQQALAVQEDLLDRLGDCPTDRSLWRESEKNEELVHRLIWEYRTEISRYLSRFTKSQLVFRDSR